MDYFNHESERLSFRKLTDGDIDSWLEFFKNNDSLHFLGMDESRSHLDLATEWINKQINRYQENGLGHLAVIEKKSAKLIGFSGIIKRELNGETFFEIGYSFKPSSWGKGYASEAARHFKSVGLKLKIAKKFISIIHIENKASMNVAKKNDMAQLFNSHYMGMEVIVYGDK